MACQRVSNLVRDFWAHRTSLRRGSLATCSGPVPFDASIPECAWHSPRVGRWSELGCVSARTPSHRPSYWQRYVRPEPSRFVLQQINRVFAGIQPILRRIFQTKFCFWVTVVAYSLAARQTIVSNSWNKNKKIHFKCV